MSKTGIHFQVSERKLLLRGVDLMVVVFGLYFLGLFFDYTYLDICWDNSVAIFILLLYLAVFGTVFEIYDLQKSSQLDVTFRTIVLTVSTTVLVYFLTPVLTPFLPEKRLQIFYFYLTIILFIFLWRMAYVKMIASPRFCKKVLIVGETTYVDDFVKALGHSDPHYKIIGFINSELPHNKTMTKYHGIREYPASELQKIIMDEKICEVVIGSDNAETITPEIYSDLMTLLERGFTIREYTQVYEEMTHRVPIQFVGKDFYKYFPFSRSNQNTLYLFFQRVLDILFSAVGLVFMVILLPLIWVGNYFGNKGPMFYKQERVGKNGRVFRIVKLRSMVVNAETNGAEWSQINDVRITKFGKFLRRSRLDEMPQFINILKGEMSVIGPRPERPFFVSELAKVIPFYETRHVVKPGLTGWAQVKTRYGASVDDSLTKLQYDLFYIKHRSVFLDLNIMIKTLSTVLYYRGQ